MIVDTSALLAILFEEPERLAFTSVLSLDPAPRISTASFLEAAVVTDSLPDPILSRRLDEVLEELDVRLEPVTEEQARIARQAYRDFGKGTGHPAQLNFGDCFAYALAKAAGESLLFKGDDFGHTDIKPVPLA